MKTSDNAFNSVMSAYKTMLTEAASPKVSSETYSWGKLKKIEAGNQYSIPLHPEHWEKLEALGDGEKHAFQDETKRKWTATREGDKLNFTDSHYGKGSLNPSISLDALKNA